MTSGEAKFLFSVIIPTYNRAEKLKRALESIAQQTYDDYEVIVCDDGSTDDTKQVVDGFFDRMNMKYFWEENWGGPARARNSGIRAAKGKWVCFLDSDDWWYRRKLEIVRNYLSEADIFYHDLAVYSEKRTRLFRKLRGRKVCKPVFVDLMRNGNVLPNSSVVARKDIIEQAGGFCEDKSLISVEDFDLWLRISRITDRFHYIRRILGMYWDGGGNITEMSEEQIAKVEKVYKKYLPFLGEEDRRQAEKAMSYSIGRIKQRMGLWDEAFESFKTSVGGTSLELSLKSMCCMVWSYIIGKRFRRSVRSK